jgi:hypothetical protein
MKTNISAFDGWFRTLLFIVSLCAAIMAGGSLWYLVIPTTILFATALLTWCPIYEMLGLSTAKGH